MAEPKHNERFERSHQRFVPGWDRESVTVSDQVMARIAKKKELMRGITLFSCETRAPAPSKDLCHLVITEKGVMWRKWKISLRGMTSGSAPVPQPVEECMSYIDFRCDDALMVTILICMFETKDSPLFLWMSMGGGGELLHNMSRINIINIM